MINTTAATVGDVLISVVAILHVYICYLESLQWYRGAARAFGIRQNDIGTTAVLACNQGFYNVVLAAGCVYSLLAGDWNAKVFFATAIFGCGAFGFVTTGSGRILRAQCAPTGAALVALFVARRSTHEVDLVPVALVLAAIFGSAGLAVFVKKRLDNDAAKKRAQ